MPVISMRLDDELLNKINEIAKKTGKKRNQIIKEILAKELREKENLEEIIEQMKKGKKTGDLSLKEVEEWFERTKPEFETWEEAIEHSRKEI